MRALLATRHYDLVWGHIFDGNLYATFVRWIAPKTKSVITLHTEGYSESPPRTIKGRIFVFLEKALLTRTAAKVAVSAAVARDFEAFFGWREVAVIHNGVVASEVPLPPDDARRMQIRAEHGVTSADDFMIVTPSRFIPKKGHFVLLDALDILNRESRGSRNWWPGALSRHCSDRLRAQAAELGLVGAVDFAPRCRTVSFFPLSSPPTLSLFPPCENLLELPQPKPCCSAFRLCLLRSMAFSNWWAIAGAQLWSLPRPQGLAEAIWSLKRTRICAGGGGTRTSADRGEFRNVRLRLEMGAVVRSRTLTIAQSPPNCTRLWITKARAPCAAYNSDFGNVEIE